MVECSARAGRRRLRCGYGGQAHRDRRVAASSAIRFGLCVHDDYESGLQLLCVPQGNTKSHKKVNQANLLASPNATWVCRLQPHCQGTAFRLFHPLSAGNAACNPKPPDDP